MKRVYGNIPYQLAMNWYILRELVIKQIDLDDRKWREMISDLGSLQTFTFKVSYFFNSKALEDGIVRWLRDENCGAARRKSNNTTTTDLRKR